MLINHLCHKSFHMKITTIPTGYFKLDGGAMFGVVPQKLWSRLNPPDDNNLCTWAMTCLLIESGDRKILVDTGLGDKQNEKWRSYFEPHGEDSLINSLKINGVTPEEITDVFLTHLHFDHCGGAVKYNDKGDLVPTFPNAKYWTNEKHWKWAVDPNPREKASFLKENILPLEKAGVLNFIDVQKDAVEWLPGLNVHFAYGHTEALMALEIEQENGNLIYAADLMPSSFHISMPYVMAYDIRPLVTMEEKAWLYDICLEKDWTIVFEHDPKSAFGKLEKNEKGRVVIKESW